MIAALILGQSLRFSIAPPVWEMGLRRFIAEAERLLRSAGVQEPLVQVNRDPGFGEVSSTAAFQLAKSLGRSPKLIAEEIAARIDVSKSDLISAVEAINGYVNFKANWMEYSRVILEEILSSGERYGSSGAGTGKRIIIEHTSVNPNKPLHVGHARNVCIGDTLARLYRFLGYDVLVLNYIDDSGTQMADVVLGFMELGYSLDPPAGMSFDEYCGDVVYVESVRRAESDPSLAEKRRQITREIESRSGKAFELNSMIVRRVLMDQLKTCWRLGARYDLLNMESDILAYGLWDEVFEKLRAAGAVYFADSGPKAGCWLLDLSGHPVLSKEGDEVLIKSDGTTTYIARDIAYATWKLGASSKDFSYEVFGENPDGSRIYATSMSGGARIPISGAVKVINVIDVRQRRPQEIVRYALGLLGLDATKYVHYGYEVVALSRKDAERLGYSPEPSQKVVHMSGRRGLYIKVDQLLNMLRERAMKEVRERHPDWSDEIIFETGEKIAVAALRYALIRQDIDKLIVIDTDEIMRLEGATGPYLQYTYARALRILEKAGSEFSTAPPSEPGEHEKTLLRKMAYLPILLDEFHSSMLIKPIADYAYELASEFNIFYENVPVLRAEHGERAFRLAIVKSFVTVFSIVLDLLGIPRLDFM
ncbi:MAG: arginine--tRNA ligase [Nitrososphaerota archaeon]